MKPLSDRHLQQLYDRSGAARWQLSLEQFRLAIQLSVAHAAETGQAGLQQYIDRLYIEDLALAAACNAGHEPAWEHFVREHRPQLYRAAEAIDHTGGARELADSLYAELYGLRERGGVRQSLFRYFHGRSSLGTWLRAVLAQRLVDGVRRTKREQPLSDVEPVAPEPAADADPEWPRFSAAMRTALTDATGALPARDRLRLRAYYVQNLTLAQIGTLLKEHEATVSRHLARTRRDIRQAVEDALRATHRFDDAAIGQCFASVIADPGTLDVAELISVAPAGKNNVSDRSE